MKGINYPLIRMIFALIIGLVIVLWPNTAINYLIITIGVLFLIPSIISGVNYLANKSKHGSSFPLEGIGSGLFGLFLVIMPEFFADILTIILGVAVMLGGIQQIIALARARRWNNVPVFLFIVPVLIFFAGLYVIVNPNDARATGMMIIGITAIVYAVFEIINWMSFSKEKSSNTESNYIKIDDNK